MRSKVSYTSTQQSTTLEPEAAYKRQGLGRGQSSNTIEDQEKFLGFFFSFPIATKVTVHGFNSVILEILKYDYSAYLRG